MSGIARAASTIPGNVATFCNRSSEPSRRIACRISSSAKTRAGTRMSGRESAGSSYSVSSILRGSDIEHHARAPGPAGFFEGEVVISGRLHDRLDGRPPSREPDGKVISLELRGRIVRDEALGVGEVDQLLQQPDEETSRVASGQLDAVLGSLAVRRKLDIATEGIGRVAENLLRAAPCDDELDLGGVLPPFVGHLNTSALQPATKPSNTSSTPRSEGWERSTSTSSHCSRPSAPAPSSAPKQSSVSVEITLRRPL